MMDPMAGLDGGDTQAGAHADGENSKEVFDSIALQRNMQRVDKIRSVMGIASGCVSGVMGLTGLEGLGAFLSFVLLGLVGLLMLLPSLATIMAYV